MMPAENQNQQYQQPMPSPTIVLDGRRVELVAGPLCGKFVRWTQNVGKNLFSYWGGSCIYKYEGSDKAIYVSG
jgi:hypothetical protein